MYHRHTLYFPRLFEAKGRRIIQVSVLAENVPGIIAQVSALVADRGINILWGVHHAAEDPAKAWWCFFIEAQGISASELESLIKGSPGVVEVYASEANVGQMVLDKHHGTQRLGPDIVVEFRHGWITGMFREMYKRWGEDGKRILTHMGFYGGRRSYPEWRERFGLEGKELVEAALGVIQTLGWTESWKVVEFDPSACRAVVRLIGAFEAREPADEPICHFLRGVLTGFFTEMFGEACYGTETKCQAVGDPYCEFVMSRKPFVFEESKQT